MMARNTHTTTDNKKYFQLRIKTATQKRMSSKVSISFSWALSTFWFFNSIFCITYRDKEIIREARDATIPTNVPLTERYVKLVLPLTFTDLFDSTYTKSFCCK